MICLLPRSGPGGYGSLGRLWIAEDIINPAGLLYAIMSAPSLRSGDALRDFFEQCVFEEGSVSSILFMEFVGGSVTRVESGIEVPHGHDGIGWVLGSKVCYVFVHLGSDLCRSWGGGGAVYA